MAERVKPYDPNEILNRPICPLTWLTNGERCVHCDPECAWFDSDAGICGMLALSKNMNKIRDDLDIFAEYITVRRRDV